MMGRSEVVPSQLEVDYDRNITSLYKALTQSQWVDAIDAIKANPEEAKTWVVRHYDDAESAPSGEREIMWRFLPIHSACARQPPANVISALLEAYPDGGRCVDDQGMYALHYACGNQAPREVIRLLLMSYPEAAKMKDPRGMLPIHYVACWGPSSISVVDMVLVANRDVADACDEDGNTPIDLAMEGEYAERDAVVAALKRWLDNGSRKSRSEAGSGAVARGGPSSTKPSIFTSSSSSSARSMGTSEEKKQEERDLKVASVTTNGGVPSRNINTLDVQHLHQEIVKLEQMQKNIDYEWETRYRNQEKSYIERIAKMEERLSAMENEAKYDKYTIEDLEKQLREKHEHVENHKVVLNRAFDERDGLRQTLADMTENHDKFKNRAEILNDRLGSMNASLLTMMEQQEVVLSSMKAREEQWLALSDLRREKLKELVSLEEKETADEFEITSCLMKQAKEMEAIKAVIAAVRQQGSV
jgi:hypothetical protein